MTRLLALCIGLVFTLSSAAAQEAESEAQGENWSLTIHGGAGVISRDRLTEEKDAEIRAALDKALEIGAKILAEGGTSMDAAEATIMSLENDPNFNAGRGAVFTWEGRNEMDSSIMDGKTRQAGAVAGATTTKNPILLARAVMERSPHVMLSGEGANIFSREQGLEQAGPEWFATPNRREQLDEYKRRLSSDADGPEGKGVSHIDIDMKYGTVGAVAMDRSGNMAAGTSTGGMTGKRWNRIGDSPIIGAGTYADNRACAISATGSGEYFIRLGVAHEICARIRFEGEDAKTAADHVIRELGELGGDGGVIVAAPDGSAAWSYNTEGMYRGTISSDGSKKVAIYGDED